MKTLARSPELDSLLMDRVQRLMYHVRVEGLRSPSL
jgi:hypothetical protein